MERDFNHLKDWLIPRIEAKGLTLEKFSTRVGVSRAVVYLWLHDINRPTEETMVRVCQVLDEPLAEGLAQYTPKKMGRPAGSKTVTRRGR